MAEWHLKDLENQIQNIGWKIISRLNGDDYQISGTWIIKRQSTRQIDFEGFDDLITFPIEKSYSCRVRNTEIDLYFYKKGEIWYNHLAKFISELNKIS